MELLVLIIIAVLAYVAYSVLYRNWVDFRASSPLVKQKGYLNFILETFKPIPYNVDKPENMHIKEGIGYCDLYDEVDHTRGKFHYFYKTDSDQHDPRKKEFYRIKYSVDAKLFGVFPSWKTYTTRCAFRPGIDTAFVAPGQEPGISEDGLIVIKRSLDGTRLSSQSNNMLRHKVLDLEHQMEVMANFNLMLRDKERFSSYKPTGQEFLDELKNGMENLRKLDKKEVTPGFNPYANDLYSGLERPMNPGVRPEGEGGWDVGGT